MSTILVVDDVKTDRDLIGSLVTRSGNQPVFAADGEEALVRADEYKPALVLMDVVMPKLDGYGACRKLKQNPATKQIPVVLVTSKGSDSDVFWGKRQGAGEVVPKPFAAEALLAVIRRFVG